MQASSIGFIFIALSVIFLGVAFRNYLQTKGELNSGSTDLDQDRIHFCCGRYCAVVFTWQIIRGAMQWRTLGSMAVLHFKVALSCPPVLNGLMLRLQLPKDHNL